MNGEERPSHYSSTSHSQVTHHGTRVAPQRCPIPQVSIFTIVEMGTFAKANYLEISSINIKIQQEIYCLTLL
jgi:hypothetical protein